MKKLVVLNEYILKVIVIIGYFDLLIINDVGMLILNDYCCIDLVVIKNLLCFIDVLVIVLEEMEI